MYGELMDWLGLIMLFCGLLILIDLIIEPLASKLPKPKRWRKWHK